MGDVPTEWYREEEHVGYDADGRRILKRKWNDSIEHLLHMVDDPSYWRKVFDEREDKELAISKPQLELIRRLRGSILPNKFFGDSLQQEEAPRETAELLLPSAREPKRRFVPSKWEAKLVLRIIRALRNGQANKRADDTKEDAPKLIWDSSEQDADVKTNGLSYLPAPKAKIPGHEDSYNPPFEYRQDAADELSDDGNQTISRQFYDALRRVPAYSPYVVERFQRCLDLYLCPRVAKDRLKIQPNDILPPLPSPQELKPFPSLRCLKYLGHSDKVLSIAIDPSGQWLLSGSADCSMRKWEITTGRCVNEWKFDEEVKCVSWCPRPESSLVSACVGNCVVLLNPNEESRAGILEQLTADAKNADESSPPWHEKEGITLVKHSAAVVKVSWHHKGDYFATLVSGGHNVLIHRVSRKSSQQIFRQQRIPIQGVIFHPTRPIMFICTSSHVYLYDLQRQCLVKKLFNGGQSMSCIAAHAGGDNIIVGGKDGKLAWFDMDLSNMPYKVMASHTSAIKGVAFHKKYPLFASVSDDATIHVFYGMVHLDLNQNALIVPLKILRSHSPCDCEGVLDCVFHPTQPWLFSAGADKSIMLFCDEA